MNPSSWRGGRWLRRLGATVVLLAWIVPAVARAQSVRDEPDAFVNQQRAVQERLRRDFDAEVGSGQRTLFDWGGWYSLHLFVFDDGVESSRTLRRHDLRLWSRVTLDRGAHEFYARSRLSLLDFNAGDAFDGNEDDIQGTNLERGYYRFSLSKALQAYGGRALDWDLGFTAGRDLVQFGTGLTLAIPLDHVALTADYARFRLRGLAGRTVGSLQDFDLSRTASRTRRDFFGTQLSYRGLDRHEPFAYALWQRDRHSASDAATSQRFDYDSLYVGIGSTGEILKGLRYAAEGVFETGRSFGDRRFLYDNRIEAWAFLAEVEYLFRGPRRGRASIEYLFGSGDADRLGSPTNSAGGNRNDYVDRSFVGFGYRDTGLALAPRYSNLHMGRVGASCFPFPDHRRLGQLELGVDGYVFHKHHRASAISDPTASRGSGLIGWEIDAHANWHMVSDLAWTMRGGIFLPGPTYEDRTTRTFFLVGMTWSF